MKIVAILAAVVIAGIVTVSAYFGIQNQFVEADQNVENKLGQLDAAYQRRNDLIPNLVKIVEASASFEKDTLTQIIEARAAASQVRLTTDDLSSPEKVAKFQEAQANVQSALSRLLVTVEKYPDLKSTQAFRDLMIQLEGTENRINTERGNYNDAVTAYNTTILKMPNRFFAGGYSKRETFKADSGAEKAPQINFGGGK
jgi:LemA protein